ncbi:ATP-binding protein [uncultured Rhodospira sp.]|uniref:sensor histidine kinase n=1 Tax=uncultured Rhodospira sp. TaxID=1936189 RepID=UPI0026307D46|nr:ATP-binding protein [uncultured Rhodospira sp.]
MVRSWTITHWLAAIVIAAVVCSGIAVIVLVRYQEAASVAALAESRARATSEQVFEHVYLSMRHGPTPGELTGIVDRLNTKLEAASVNLVRSESVALQYGDSPGARAARANDPEIKRVLSSGREEVIRDGNTLRFLHPLKLVEECAACHVGTIGETVNGVMDIRFSLNVLEQPLGFLTGTAFLGFLGALSLIFGTLFVAVRLLVVRPIQGLSETMTRLGTADRPEGASVGHQPQVRELAQLTDAFNTLMDRVAHQRAALEEHAAALAVAKDSAEHARIQADAANMAKSEFLASMSHELRTPLNAILGFSEVIRDEVFGPLTDPRYRSYVADIHNSGCQLRDLVNDLLDLARIEAGRLELAPETLDVAFEVGACVDLFRERAREAGLTLIRDWGRDLPPLWADPRALRQALNNLISNAIKYTPRGGSVRVAVRALADRMEIAVADTGIGIDKEFHDLVFSAYGRVINVETRNIEGTGLGLSLVKALMDQHGGTVTLESRQGEGSTFTLVFPMRPGEAGS